MTVRSGREELRSTTPVRLGQVPAQGCQGSAGCPTKGSHCRGSSLLPAPIPRPEPQPWGGGLPTAWGGQASLLQPCDLEGSSVTPGSSWGHGDAGK